MSGRRHATRLVTAVLVLGSGSLAFLPLAHASTVTTVTPSQEAWYQPNPSCAQASGCVTPATSPVAPPAAVPLSPYPAGTLHIGYAGGQETARSYLALPLASVVGTLEAASLDIPLDVAPENGSQAPETAKLQACLFSEAVTPADGSIAAPPKTTCDVAAPVTYVATPTPHLHADLAPLAQGLLTSAGIALLPDATKVGQTDAWRVVFSAHSRADAAKTPPATVTLTVADPATASGPVVAQPDDPVLGPVAPPVGTGFAPAPMPAAEAPTVDPPAVVPPTTVDTRQVAQPTTITVGYAYPAVWLLPLAFLILVPATARALTKDLVA